MSIDSVRILPARAIASDFLPPEYVPADGDQYTIRNSQFRHADRPWRPLTTAEIETLVKNGNTADDWKDIRVSDPFNPHQILHSSFFGLVRIGVVEDVVLEHHDLKLPVGITNCRIVSCDIGDQVALHNVHYLAHYIIGDRSILTNIDEMHVSNHAKFGNGIVKAGEDEEVRVTLDVINETGSRAIAPFDGMTTADAYLWARYREDETLQARLLEFTQEYIDDRRGYYGEIGEQNVLKNTRIVKDVKTGGHSYIKGANKLKNLTINSDERERTQIGEGVELVNGIIGYGCRIFYGCKAVRFIMGNNSNLKYGARLIHSFLGDNSTVSCCELLNNLIFPAHEQHHNNSFLVAAMVGGQSNIAAGATIGSNHNSRSNDNEIIAGRGFWPGLSTTLKHSSRFASFTLIAKGDYPAEIDLPLPFALLSHNVGERRLEVTPAFWWMRNMYALARNSWKFGARDTRVHRTQHLQYDALAPDTVEEIIAARTLLEEWTGAAALNTESRWSPNHGTYPELVSRTLKDPEHRRLQEEGRRILTDESHAISEPLLVNGLEKTRRAAAINHVRESWIAYGEMLHHYAASHIVSHLESDPAAGERSPRGELPRVSAWINMGGQLVPEAEVTTLRAEIADGTLTSWRAVHHRYDELHRRYPQDLVAHAWAVAELLAGDFTSPTALAKFLRSAVTIQELVRDRVHESRRKDYENPFRIATYRSPEEMDAAIGSVDDNSFVQQVAEQTEQFATRVESVIASLP